MTSLTRRAFLKFATMVAAATATDAQTATAVGAPADKRTRTAGNIVDTNVWLSLWPFRRLPLDETAALVTKLRNSGVTTAWAGSFDGMLHKDLGAVNERLAGECRQHGRGMLIPFGVINPMLPDWKEELRRCRETHEMRGIRLHPNYHGYKLDRPVFAELLDLATERGLIVQIAMSMEDERMQQPLMQVPHVDAAPLVEVLNDRRNAKVVLLNWFRAVKGDLLPKLAEAAQIFFEIATVEGVGGVGTLLKQVPPERILFGSYAPFFYFESAALKLKESAMSQQDLVRIRRENAMQVLTKTP
jgi:predicted TIM-barrel fold metal-dependent hydrolase